MKLPAPIPTKVTAAFYMDADEFFIKVYNFFSCKLCGYPPFSHCALILENKLDKVIILPYDNKMKMIRYDVYMRAQRKETPEFDKHISYVDCGEAPVSFSQISYITSSYRKTLSTPYENLFWYCTGRFISDTYTITTCTQAVSQILRVCGYSNNIHTEPHKLHEELSNGIDNYFWTS